MREMLQQHGFFATDKELKCLMDKFDKDKDGRISFTEFAEELRPKL